MDKGAMFRVNRLTRAAYLETKVFVRKLEALSVALGRRSGFVWKASLQVVAYGDWPLLARWTSPAYQHGKWRPWAMCLLACCCLRHYLLCTSRLDLLLRLWY